MSLLAKIEAWFSKEEAVVKPEFTAAEQWAIKKLHASWTALAALAESKGIVILEDAILKGGAAAALALATGPSAAGAAFIAAAGAVVQAEAPDALHALSAAAVTEAKQAAQEAAKAVEAAASPAPAVVVSGEGGGTADAAVGETAA